jgi:DNA polymerase
MAADVRDGERRYLERRRMSGAEVVYRVAAESAGEPAAPAGPPDGIPVATSPAPPAEERRGVRFSRDRHVPVQSSLFAGPAPAERFDPGANDLGSLERLVSACRRCGLCDGRTRTVFGSGSPAAKIVFIGEAPGREEDLQGLPFVGRAGQLLTKMLAAIGFTREEVYITNILKCRPPNNRDPQEDEMGACEPYLARQLEIIRPAVICALGRVAAHGLLKKGTSLSFLRRAVHYYNDIPVAVTYHPAALLRNPNLKRDAWEDLQMARRLHDERIREE